MLLVWQHSTHTSFNEYIPIYIRTYLNIIIRLVFHEICIRHLKSLFAPSENSIHIANGVDVDVRVFIVWLAANSNHSIISIHALAVAFAVAAVLAVHMAI